MGLHRAPVISLHMVWGMGKETMNVVWAAVALEHDTPLTYVSGIG